MFSSLFSMGIFGMEPFPVRVEADLANGLPAFEIVGLPDLSVRESRDRVRAALRNCGCTFPTGRITVNLAPADKRKSGPDYDLPILIALLCASSQLSADALAKSVFLGELSLSGALRPIRGALPMAAAAREAGFDTLYLPADNASEGAAAGIRTYPVETVGALLRHLRGEQPLLPAEMGAVPALNGAPLPDFAEVRGQEDVKRALEIAASGGHNILLIGPPGSGKSMLAKRLPSILPDMTAEERMEASKIHSIAGTLPHGSALLAARPFRSPHHTTSPAGLTGGGSIPRPGEISLSHNGVLFLDELPEFGRAAMEILRQPMEDGVVSISRVGGRASFPCEAMLVAAMNPCPCGYFGHPSRACVCSSNAVSRYLSRISGPLLDRFDLHVEVPPVEFDALASGARAEASADIRKRVNAARAVQQERLHGTRATCNARITQDLLSTACALTDEARLLLKKAFERFGLSARAYSRVLKVSRTIADLEQSPKIEARHAAEAVQYRALDRKYWDREL